MCFFFRNRLAVAVNKNALKNNDFQLFNISTFAFIYKLIPLNKRYYCIK